MALADANRFKADIPGSRVVMLPDVGHLPQEEAPDETHAAIATFIAENASGNQRNPSRLVFEFASFTDSPSSRAAFSLAARDESGSSALKAWP